MIKKRDIIGERRSEFRRKQDKFLRWCYFLSTIAGCAIAAAIYSVIYGQKTTALMIILVTGISYLFILTISKIIFEKFIRGKEERKK